MVMLYRGTSQAKATALMATGPQRGRFGANGNGEFGNGCYFWLSDLKAAFLSAVQLQGVKNPWAVVSVELDDNALRQAMVAPPGFGPRVLEFPHNLESPFKDDGGQPRKDAQGRPLAGSYVVPREYSHFPMQNEDLNAASARATANLQNLNQGPTDTRETVMKAIGPKESKAFRKINQHPDRYGLQGQADQLDWQYDLILGLCAVDYSDAKLVQVKAAHAGLTHINTSGTRAVVLTGHQVTKRQTRVLNWKFATRDNLWDLYAEGRQSPIDLDQLIPS